MIIDRKDLDDLGNFIIVELIKELRAQGHDATGKLISSFEKQLSVGVGFASLQVLMEDYGRNVNQGRRAGARKVPIQALVDWIITKGIVSGQKEQLSLAFAIQKKIFQDGIPAARTNKFSRTGKRIEFIDDTLARINAIIEQTIENLAVIQIEIQVDNFVKLANSGN